MRGLMAMNRTAVAAWIVLAVHALVADAGVLPASAGADSVVGDDSAWWGLPPHGFTTQGSSRARVNDVARYHGALVAAGDFDRADGVEVPHVAVWNGVGWAPLGDPRRPPFTERIVCLAVWGDWLIAAGWGPTDSSAVMAWDGQAWRAVGSTTGSVDQLAVCGTDLVAAGLFAGPTTMRVGRWNGHSWDDWSAELWTGIAVRDLVSFEDRAHVCGRVVDSIGSHNCVLERTVEGHWSQLGGDANDVLNTLHVDRGRLLVGGYCDRFGDSPTGPLAAWDGTAWQRVGFAPDSVRVVYAVARQGNDLLAAASFNRYGFDIRRWDGQRWNALDVPEPMRFGDVTGLVEETEGVRALGEIRPRNTLFNSGPGIPIPLWDGQGWNATDSNPLFLVQARALLSTPEALLVAGVFRAANSTHYLNAVGAWDGVHWSLRGGGFDGPVTALAVHGDRVVAGGDFTAAGDLKVNDVAVWDGTRWSSLGEGVSEGAVLAFASDGRRLFAAGSFRRIGADLVDRTAVWDGQTWHPLGRGVRGSWHDVSSLEIYDGQLIACGRFEFAGEGRARVVARWDGRDWQRLDDGLEFDSYLQYNPHLTQWRGELVLASGDLLLAGGRETHGLATWNGARWVAIAPPNRFITDVTTYGDWLVVTNPDQRLAPPSTMALFDGVHWLRPGSGLWNGTQYSSSYEEEQLAAEWRGMLYIGTNQSLAGDKPTGGLAAWNGAGLRTIRRLDELGAVHNPARKPVELSWTLSAPGPVRLVVYDARGRLVNTVLRVDALGGPAHAAWDLRNARGEPAPTGIYFMHLVTERGASTRKVTVLR